MFARSAVPALLLAAATLASPTLAASFNCTKAAQPDEYAICANPGLSDMDVQMATLFQVRMQLPMLMGARGAAQDEQRAWLATRSACKGNVPCLRSAYQARLNQLNETISAAMHDYCVKLGICG